MAAVKLAKKTDLTALEVRTDAVESSHAPGTYSLVAAYVRGAGSSKQIEQLHIAVSANEGKTWDTFIPTFVPPIGSVRDPYLLWRGGWWHLFYTWGAFGVSTSLGHSRSQNLIDWEHLAAVDCSGLSGIQQAWAPKPFVDSDDSVHLFATLSTGAFYDPYLLSATNAALTTWSAPAALTGTLPHQLDGVVVKIGSTYHLLYTNFENTGYVGRATATARGGPYTVVDAEVEDANWGDQIEGPCVVTLGDGTRRIFLDKRQPALQYYSDSDDNFATWTDRLIVDVDLPAPAGFFPISVAGDAAALLNTRMVKALAGEVAVAA